LASLYLTTGSYFKTYTSQTPAKSWTRDTWLSDVHRAVHRNIISIVKPTSCTNVSNLFYGGEWHSTCFDGLSVHRQEFKTVHTATGICQTDTDVCLPVGRRWNCKYLLSSRQQYLFDKCLLLYVQSWTPDDGRKDRPKHVECHSPPKNKFDTLVQLVGFTIEIMWISLT